MQRTGALLAQTRPSVPAFPETTIGSACTSSFSRIARRLLTLRPAHSRGHQNRDRYPKASDISSPPCLLRVLPAGAVAGWALHPLEKAPPFHGARGLRTFANLFGKRLGRAGTARWAVATTHDPYSASGAWSTSCSVQSLPPYERLAFRQRVRLRPDRAVELIHMREYKLPRSTTRSPECGGPELIDRDF